MRRTTLAQQICLTALRWYQQALAPVWPMQCRFVPSCSHYAMESFVLFGVMKGSWLTLRRLLRCHPLAHGGCDPVVHEHS